MNPSKFLLLGSFITVSVTLSLFTSCDKFDLDFTTDSQFNLDASSHELEIKTKQDGALITHISLDNESFWISCPNVDCGEMEAFEKFKVYYSNGFVKEIEGEWFNVKVSPPYTFNVSISENHTDKERELIIKMLWRSANNQVVIHQKAGSGIGNNRYTSLEEAEEISDLFMGWKFGNTTTKSGSDKELKESSIIKSDNEAMMYIFNYNDGFTIIGASKGMYPILAYSETGSFTEGADISGLSTWIDFTKEEIKSSLITTKSNITVSNEIRNYELLKEMFSGNESMGTLVKPEDPGTTVCFSEIRNHIKVGPPLTTEWSQSDPWNRLSPMVDGMRAPARCVPVAIGQVDSFYI